MTPKRGETYSLQQIWEVLDLRDSPCLLVYINGIEGVIQEAHVSQEQFLSVPNFASTQWKYLYETHEWIPVFRYADKTPITDYVDYVDNNDRQGELWITPKGFPRKQYEYD